MAFKIIFLEEFGKAFVPKRFTPTLRKYLLAAGINKVPYKFFGALFYLTAVITGLLYIFFLYPFLLQYNQFVLLFASVAAWFAVQISLATLFILLVYFYIDLRIYKRTKKMEEMLPDYLQIVSSNLKGGMSFENALWGAIKPRFSILANEMAEVSKKVMTGYDIKDALAEFELKYNSPMLKRSIDLMTSELESGGKIADLIDKIVDNLKDMQSLKSEISTSAVAYIIFISVIVIVIAPLLFSLSFNLLLIIFKFGPTLTQASSRVGILPIQFAEVAVKPEEFMFFSITSLAVIAFFSSIIVSIVEKGDIKGGLKYIPIFTFGSIFFFYVFMKVLSAVFANIVV